MKSCLIFLLLIAAALSTKASDTTVSKINIGIEQDLLPYATGGYFAGIWVGKKHFRLRALTARVYKPDFVIKDDFTNNDITAWAVTADYFLNEDWKGWWIAAGIVYWNGSIQADTKLTTAKYKNWLLNGSIGYNITLYKHLYISPWAALNFRVAGDKSVLVDGKIFKPVFVNPEASLKLGIYF